MNDDVSKLPAFSTKRYEVSSDPGLVIGELVKDRDAYRARMEALVEYAREVTCENVHHKYKDYHEADKPCPVMIRLHALLAACEREEGR
jgi:hypothetical protein